MHRDPRTWRRPLPRVDERNLIAIFFYVITGKVFKTRTAPSQSRPQGDEDGDKQ